MTKSPRKNVLDVGVELGAADPDVTEHIMTLYILYDFAEGEIGYP